MTVQEMCLYWTFFSGRLRSLVPSPHCVAFPPFLLNNGHISNVSSPAHVPRYYLLFHHWTGTFRIVPVFQEPPKSIAKHSVFPAFCMELGTFSPASPTDVSVLAPGMISVQNKSSFCSFISHFVLFCHPAVVQMFLQLHIFKSQPDEKRHM